MYVSPLAYFNKSPLLLTYPRDAVPRAYRAVHRCWRVVNTCVQHGTRDDGQCDKLVTDDGHQFTTLTVHLSWQHLRRSAIPEIWLVPTKI